MLETRIVTTPHGVFHVPPGNLAGHDPVINFMEGNGVFEPYIIDYCSKHIRPGTTVIDAGANWGQMTVAFSKLVGASGCVHSIESSNFVIDYLERTLAANIECKNVVLHHRAGWHTSGEQLDMLIPHSGVAYSGAGIRGSNDERDNPSHSITSLAIDDITFTSPVSVIKIDAQGSDVYILQGAKKTLEKYHPVVVLEYETMYEPLFNVQKQQLTDFLASIDYVEVGSVGNNQHDLILVHKDKVNDV
jgi:FkbM family methyltransferase